ncbi:MAG: putative PEP-binding protein, partial [Candidatus Lutibacillus vidarii]
TAAEVKVMAPMVATPEEAAWFARRVREHGLPSVGVMIEVPGAAILSRHVLAEVDFGSLGTNDLAQYTMAADRMEGQLSDLLDPWQPAVLQVIGHACDGAKLAGKPMGVCGEAGGDPLLALVLTGLGVASLSMAPSKVAIVRYALSLHTLAECHGMATAALAQRSAQDAHDAVCALADPSLVELL